MRLQIPSIALLLFAVASRADAAAEANTLKLLYMDKPPYSFTGPDGQPHGLEVDPTVAALAAVGIKSVWKATPAPRILATIKADREPYCSPGWYQTPERLEFAQFTQAIRVQPNPVAIGSAAGSLPDSLTAQQLLDRPQTRLLIEKYISHGNFIDELVARMPAERVEMMTGDLSDMVKIVAAGRADLVIVAADEAQSVIAAAGVASKDLKIITFVSEKNYQNIYIMCSKNVPRSVIDRINTGIGQSNHSKIR